MSFSNDLNQFAANIENQANRRVRRVALAAFQEINKASPVDKGTFRANWVVAMDTLDRTFDLSKDRKDWQETVSVGMTAITNGAKLGTTIYICNSVPYAIQIENGYGGSDRVQRPEGVVEPSITVIKNAIQSGRL